MNNFPTGTVTFLFTDIKGSTKLTQEHPDTWKFRRTHNQALVQGASYDSLFQADRRTEYSKIN